MHKSILFVAAAVVGMAAFGAATVKPAGAVVDTSPAKGRVIAQSPAYNGGNSYKAEHAFDGDWSSMNNCWIADLNSTTTVAYLVYEFDNATVVGGLRIHNSGDWGPEGRAPNTWTFQGSNDNATWTVVDSRSGESSWVANEVRTYGFVNNTAYKYYKFSCTKNNMTGNGHVGIYEMEFLTSALVNLASPTAGQLVAESPEYVYNGQHYSASPIFDGVRTSGGRWIGLLSTSSAYVVYRFNEPTRVNAISIFTMEYYQTPERGPKDWTFSGSNDGETWTTLDTQTGETGWDAGGEERFYKFDNTESYEYYKFNCTAVNSGTLIQLQEMEFYCSTGPNIADCSVQYVDGNSCTVSATLADNAADRVSWILSEDGVTTTTNQFATSVAVGGTATGTITGLTPGKTYAIGILAENANGSDAALVGVLYTGELSLGATVNAVEADLTQGTVEVSRAGADPLPLMVDYTITGSTGSEGITWEVPVTVTIPAGETTGYLVVKPILDPAVSSDVTATVALAPGNYAIPAAPNNAKTLTIVNDGVMDGYTYDVVTITNAFDNPFGGAVPYLLATHADVPKNGFSNLTARVIRFVRPEDAPEGLREFAHTKATEADIQASANVFPRDWIFYTSINVAGTGSTVDCVRYSTNTVSNVTDKRGVRTYVGSWYIPADKAGTYSFRMHMRHVGLFSLDGKLILRQYGSGAVTEKGVEMSAGWHNFYAAFVGGSGNKVGPATGETLGLSFSAENATLTDAAPGSAFTAENGYKFSTAFNAALIPSMMAKGGDVFIDCANVLGDLRIIGQLGHAGYYYKIVNLPAGRTVEVGRPAYFTSTGWQNCDSFAGVDWTHMVLPPGVNVRFEGGVVVDSSWATAGHGVWNGDNHAAFSLGKGVFMATDVPNLFGTYTDEFHYPDGLLSFHAGNSDVIGKTAKIYVPDNLQFGFGGAPFIFSGSGTTKNLPMKRSNSTWKLPNEIDLGTSAVVLGTMSTSTGDELVGDITGPSAFLKMTGWSRYLTTRGSIDVKDVSVGQRGDRMCILPKTGSAPSKIRGTVTLAAESTSKNATKNSGWNYPGPILFYNSETPEGNPLSINTVSAGNAYLHPENGAYARQGSTLSACSNSTVNVAKLTGGGVHLCASIPPVISSKAAAGFANFVFGEINSSVTTNEMKIFVASNVNITVTNIIKKTGEGLPAVAFDYTLVSNDVNLAVGPNAGFLDIIGDCPASTIKAHNIEALPGRIKGFVGDIMLTDTTAGRTYDVVYDFDRGVAIGGCDGSGNLVAAPASGTINLSFTGTPKDGSVGFLKFDSVAEGLLGEGWTINAPSEYGSHTVSIVRGANGFSARVFNKGTLMMLR